MAEFIAEGVQGERARIARAGAERCRAAIADVIARRAAQQEQPVRPLTPSEEIFARAAQRAAGERRSRTYGSRAA